MTREDMAYALLVTKYKSLNSPHLDYGDIILDQAYYNSCHYNLESSQCKAWLAITGALRGTSKDNLY